MGALSARSVGQLVAGFVLAPERYDARRALGFEAPRVVGDVAEVVGQTATELPRTARVLVLDTNHAAEGLVLVAHDTVTRGSVKGTRRRLRAGDVLVSRLRPYLRQIAFVDAGLFLDEAGPREVVASPEFYVLRSRGSFDVAALVPFLLSESVQAALAAAQEGGHHPRVGVEALLALPVPEALIDISDPLAAGVRADADAVRTASVAGRRRTLEVEALLRDVRPATSPSPTR